MTFLTRSNAPPSTSPIVEAIDLTADPIEEIPPVKELNRPRTPLMAVPTPLAAPSNMPNCLIELSSPTSQSPNPAAISSRLSSKLPMLSDPNAVAMALPTALTACTPISNIENTPSATRPILFNVDSEGIRLSVNEVNASVISISCRDVVGGNTFRNALPTVDTTLPRDSKTLDRPSISSVLPPRSFHPWRRLFLDSDDRLTTSEITSATPDHNSLASSKSPNMISKVLVQPDANASFVVSIN